MYSFRKITSFSYPFGKFLFPKFPSDRNISSHLQIGKIERFDDSCAVFRPIANLASSRVRGGNKEEGNARDLVARKPGPTPSLGFIGNKYF